MGQKVNPIGLRLGINKTWSSRWFMDPKLYATTLHEDLRLRKIILNSEETKGADIAEVEIIRHPQRVTVIIHTGRPGVLIGAKGANIEKLGGKLQKSIGKKIQLRIKEIKRPETNAKLVAENISRQIKARASYRRACKMAILNAMKTGVQGIKVKISGQPLGGGDGAAGGVQGGAHPSAHLPGGHRLRHRDGHHHLRVRGDQGVGIQRGSLRPGKEGRCRPARPPRPGRPRRPDDRDRGRERGQE